METNLIQDWDFPYRAFSHDVTAAILVFENNGMASMLVFETNPVGDELFLCKRFPLFQWICIDAGQVSKNALYS